MVVVVVFWVKLSKVNIFVFSDLIINENINDDKSIEKVFLMFKIEPGFMGSLVYFLF
jgi:hypothetical protein